MADQAHTEVAGAEHHASPTAFGIDPSGFVALSMLAVFAIMLWKRVPAMIAGMLDGKIAEIRTQLDEAARLRKEAEALKAEYEGKLADAAKHAEAVKAGAEEEAGHIVTKAKSDAEALIVRRRKMAEDKIAAAERTAVAELRAKAAETAAAAAAGLIAQGHDAKADKGLVDEAIAGL
jgi:F-type H+-transporting ATPase subunit b